MINLDRERIETEILVIGGGPAGLMAAIRAADLGVKDIVVADKSNTEHSGNAGAGSQNFIKNRPEREL